MTRVTAFWWVLCSYLFAEVVGQQNTLSHCVNGATRLPACDSWSAQQASCGALATASSVTAYYNCYCAQSFFNGIWDCESEERLCLGSSEIDPYFDPIRSVWHKACDRIINYNLTTPTLSSITDSYDVGWCTVASSSCVSLSIAEAGCTVGYHPGLQSSLTSCLCQTSLLSLAYTCYYLGNVSCILTPAALSNMPQWTHCSDFEAVLGSTGPTATPTLPRSSSASITASVSGSAAVTTPPASPASTASSTYLGATKTGAADRLARVSNIGSIRVISWLIAVLWVN